MTCFGRFHRDTSSSLPLGSASFAASVELLVHSAADCCFAIAIVHAAIAARPGGGLLARSAIFSTRLILPTTSRVWALSYCSPEPFVTRT